MTSNLKVPVPDEYISEVDIEMWIEELQNYMLAAAGTLPQERKKAILKTCICKQGRLAISNFHESEKKS